LPSTSIVEAEPVVAVLLLGGEATDLLDWRAGLWVAEDLIGPGQADAFGEREDLQTGEIQSFNLPHDRIRFH
jgi:hypothetical protein